MTKTMLAREKKEVLAVGKGGVCWVGLSEFATSDILWLQCERAEFDRYEIAERVAVMVEREAG